MKRLTAITSAAALALVLPIAAIGQDAATDESIDDVTVLIANAGEQPVDLSGITDSTSVKIVKLSSLRQSASGSRNVFNMTLKSFASGLESLRSAVSGNATLSAKLSAEGMAAEDVLAVNKAADGSLTIYVNDEA